MGRAASGILLIGLLAPTGGAAFGARPRVYAIQGARIVPAPGWVIESGTVVIRDGTIAAVGAGVEVPPDAEIVEGKGLTVYAGLIDPFTRLGMPAPPAAEESAGPSRERPRPADRPAERGPSRPNVQVRADAKASLLYQPPAESELERMRAEGFTAALIVPEGGVFRGTSALVHLGPGDPSRAIISAEVASHLAFETARGKLYPSSLMGVLALIRQTFLDARRHAVWTERWRRNPQGLERPPHAPALEAVSQILGGGRTIFEAEDAHALGRIEGLAREFSFRPIVVGSGYEYEIEDQVRTAGLPLILPVAFPEPPHMEDDDAALDVTTRTLRRWDQAPGNLEAMRRAGVRFALTTHRLRSPFDFRKNVRRAIERGLPETAALEAVTLAPARLLGVEKILGTIEKGKIANLILADGELFAEKTSIKRLFIDGAPLDVEEESPDFDADAKVDPRGTWELTYTFGGRRVTRTWTIGGEPSAYSGEGETQAGKVALSDLVLIGNRLRGSYAAGRERRVEFTWYIKGEELKGQLATPDGSKISFTGRRIGLPDQEGL